MPLSGQGVKLITELQTGFPTTCHNMWPIGMAMPWQPSQNLYRTPVHYVTQQLNSQWFTVENFMSLPSKSKQEKECTSAFENFKPLRRYSDPGPSISTRERNSGKTTHDSKMFIPKAEEWNQIFFGKFLSFLQHIMMPH